MNAARLLPARALMLPSALMLSLGLCACATTVVPTAVRFPALKPGPEAVQLYDARPTEARAYREQGESRRYKFFGDDAMRPSPLDLVASRVGAALPESRRDQAIELRRLDIGFLVSSRSLLPTASDTSIAVPSGTPAAAVAAGLLLTYGMITAFNRPRDDSSGVAYIEVGIGADSLRTAQTVAVTRHVDAVQAVESAFASALDDLADQARALTPRAP